MSSTFLMSYPGPAWQIRGAQNFRSQARQGTSPRAAFAEWLRLCDSIVRLGGHILVMPPSTTDNLTGMVYTANAGALFVDHDAPNFFVSDMSVEHRKAERAHIEQFWRAAGMPFTESSHVWEGQAEICTLPSNRYILSWGVRSVKASLDEVRPQLTPGHKTLDVQLREPFFHGDTCLNPLKSKGGDWVLLAHEGALVDRTLVELRSFLGTLAEVIPVDEADALGYACNAVCVNGTVLLPEGLSTSLRGNLLKHGFQVEEIALPELFGKGGGGPRCLVNELRGFVMNDSAPDYARKRSELHALLQSYPDSVA